MAISSLPLSNLIFKGFKLLLLELGKGSYFAKLSLDHSLLSNDLLETMSGCLHFSKRRLMQRTLVLKIFFNCLQSLLSAV